MRKGGIVAATEKLSIELDPQLMRRVKLAAVGQDQSIRDWVVNAIKHGLDREIEDGLIMGQKRTKPLGIENPPRPRSGRLVSDAVVEDRDGSW